jgi:hypothetical protein
MSNDSLLNKVKRSLLIPESETFADGEIEVLIHSCQELLSSTGVSQDTIQSSETAVTLILIYCKTFFGFKSDGSVRELPSSFYTILNQLAISRGE